MIANKKTDTQDLKDMTKGSGYRCIIKYLSKDKNHLNKKRL